MPSPIFPPRFMRIHTYFMNNRIICKLLNNVIKSILVRWIQLKNMVEVIPKDTISSVLFKEVSNCSNASKNL